MVSWDVWIALISLLLIVPLVWKISQYSSDPTENVKIIELFEGSLFILLQQGSEFLPTKISSKIVLLSIAVFSLVFVEFYSCDLFASFAVTQFKLPFQDMFQLYQSEYKMGGLNEMWKSYFKVHFWSKISIRTTLIILNFNLSFFRQGLRYRKNFWLISG